MKTKYFLKTEQSVQPSNKLHRDLNAFVNEWDGTLINNPKAFYKDVIIPQVAELNELNKRCLPAIPTFPDRSYSEDISIGIHAGNWYKYMRVYKVEREL